MHYRCILRQRSQVSWQSQLKASRVSVGFGADLREDE